MDPQGPAEEAGCFSKIFYLWLNPIFIKSRKQTLTRDDVYMRPSVEASENVTERLEQEWNKERSKKNPSLFKALFKTHSFMLLMSAITICLEMIIYTFRPFVMKKILLSFADMSATRNKIEATLFCLLLVIATLTAVFLRNTSFWLAYLMGMRLRVASSGLIYRKILRLNQKAISETAAGQVINLLSTDVQRFELSFMFIHYGWIAPLQALVVFWLMSEIDLYPTLCAAAVMTFFIPMQTLMNRAYAHLKLRISKVTDMRIRILSDIVNGVKIIKLHAWENWFSKVVNEVRTKETRLFMFIRLCQAFQFTQLVYQVKVTTMAMLLAIVLLHEGAGDPEALRSHELYTLLNYLNSLFLSLTLFMPICIQYFYDTKVSCRRIQDFLLIPEMKGERKPHILDSEVPQLQCFDVTASWCRMSGGQVTLKNISLDVSGPKLIAVVGSVGSGKSSLLQVILGELPHFDGFVMRSRNVAYMPQLSWIFPGTVRDNVLGSLPYNHERYTQVLQATTLDVDIKNLLHGDCTQVGERGVSLSGGQKARIGLARIAYTEAAFVLLDDPLAAVDARVANHLFEHCICGILSDRLRILVTHQHHLLPKMDMIVVMREGEIKHVGTYDQLIKDGVNFQTLVYNIRDEEPTLQKEYSSQIKRIIEENVEGLSRDEPSNVTSFEPDADKVEETRLLTFEQAKPIDLYSYTATSVEALSMSGSMNVRPEFGRTEDMQYNPPVSFSSTQNIEDLCCRLRPLNTQGEIAKRQRTLSSMEPSDRAEGPMVLDQNTLTRSMSQGRARHRQKFVEQDSMASVRTITPRGSVTSRLAFSIESALASGIMLTVEDGNMNPLNDYEENDDEPIQVKKNDSDTKVDSLDALLKKNTLDHAEKNAGEEEIEDTAVAEEWQHGKVKWRHYLILGRIGGGIFGFFFSIFMFVLTITNYAGCDVWIAQWSEFVDGRALNNSSEPHNVTIVSNNILLKWDISNNHVALIIYCCLTGSLVIISSLRSLIFFGILINSAKQLHKRMLNACMRTRLTFFETNPSGRILNRFSKDIGQLDDLLPTTIHDFLQCFFLVVSIGVVTITSSYWIIIPTVPILVVFYFTRRYYLFTSRDLKRIEAVARSPVFTWVNITIQGLACIRASGSEKHHLKRYNDVMDSHTSVFYMNIAAARWLSIRLDLLCVIYLAVVVSVCLLLGNFSHVSSAEVGLMITYATGLIGLFQWCVRQSAEVENQMISVERTVEYMDLEPEITEPPILPIPEDWPSNGRIIFDSAWLRYAATAPWALRDIRLIINGGQKVGVVGRTGAGKSSLISAIFRLVELESGQILIDNVNIARLNLTELRKRISIIPQDPIMFSGTVRSNLDPDHKMKDETIWSALASVQLDKVISHLPGGLQAPICEGGSNFSTGQRQLLALARAILGGNRILVVDEATANVDPGTDYVIQNTLRNQFAAFTVITVAHRLHTVIDNELIVVMENGRVVEFGPPHELLNPEQARLDRVQVENDLPPRPNQQISLENPITGCGPFAALVSQTGTEESGILAHMARNAYIQTLTRKGIN